MAIPPDKRPGVYTALDYAAITPSDTVNFPKGICTAIYVGTGGTIPVVRWDGTVVPFVCPSGSVLSVMAIRINSTGIVTADNMVALY